MLSNSPVNTTMGMKIATLDNTAAGSAADSNIVMAQGTLSTLSYNNTAGQANGPRASKYPNCI